MLKNRQKEAKRLSQILARSVEVYTPYVRANELSRLSFYGQIDSVDLNRPTAHFNDFRKACINGAGRLIAGSPSLSSLPRPGRSDRLDTTRFLTDEMNALIGDRLRVCAVSQALDLHRYGCGWLYVTENDELISLSWFDVYVDNAMGRTFDLWSTARYVFVRRLANKTDFEERFPSWNSEKDSADSSFTTRDGVNLPGRQPIGIDVPHKHYRTQTFLNADGVTSSIDTGVDLSGLSGSNSSASLSKDSLVEYFDVYEVTSDGWMSYKLKGDSFLEDPELIHSNLDVPPLFFYTLDDDNEQFVTPGIFPFFIPNQKFINFWLHRMGGAMDRIATPPVLNPKSSGITDEQLATELEKVNSIIGVVSGLDKPEFMKYPEFPYQWINVVNLVREINEENETLPPVMQGESPSANSSGTAIDQLRREGEMSVSRLPVKRDAMFRSLAKYICKRIYHGYYKIAQEMADAYNSDELETLNGESRQSYVDRIETTNKRLTLMGQSDELIPVSEEAQTVDFVQFMPEPLQNITANDFDDDLLFYYTATPPQTRDEQFNSIFMVMGVVFPMMQTVFPMAPHLAFKSSLEIVAKWTGNVSMIEEITAELETHFQENQQIEQETLSAQQQKEQEELDIKRQQAQSRADVRPQKPPSFHP